MNGIIIYKSKYGSTREYAEWLRAETGFTLFDVKHCPRDLGGYDVVVLGCSVFAGKLNLASWLRQRWAQLQGKQVLLFVTHVNTGEGEFAKVVPQSLPEDIAQQLKVFPVGGRYNLQQMSFLDRTLIKMVSSMEKRPEVKAELLTERDFVKRENLNDILATLRDLAASDGR